MFVVLFCRGQLSKLVNKVKKFLPCRTTPVGPSVPIMTFTSGPTSELRSCALKSCLFELSPRSNGKIMKLAGKNTVGTVVLAVLKTLVTFNALRDQMS